MSSSSSDIIPSRLIMMIPVIVLVAGVALIRVASVITVAVG